MIKSGAVVQNRYLNNPYPSNHNPLGRPGNFDVARPYDASSVFDTGIPKDVSPYQPRVAVSVEIQPKSVFKPRRLQRQLKQVNGATWGQTALKSIFGGEENVITNYMAQRLLGIVDGSKSDSRMDQPMSVDTGSAWQMRDQVNSSGGSTSQATPTVKSDVSMGEGGANPTPGEIADLTDLSLGEIPLRITTQEDQPSGFNPELQGALDDDAVMETVAETETQPAEAAAQGGLLIPPPPPPPPPPIVQQTAAGTTTIRQRDRTTDKRTAVERFLNPFDLDINPVVQSSDNPLMAAIRGGVKLRKVADTKPVQKAVKNVDPLMGALSAALSKRRQKIADDDGNSEEWN